MGIVVLSLTVVVALAIAVVWGALVWEKDSGGLTPEGTARVEAVQRYTAEAMRQAQARSRSTVQAIEAKLKASHEVS